MTRLPLSVIVPVLNEMDQLPKLVTSLRRQQNIRFELLLCDGGSRDGTADIARKQASRADFPVKLLNSPPGRSVQMNAGAQLATGEWFLFLHVDSEFDDPNALMLAVADMERERSLAEGCSAGHFPVHFSRTSSSSPFAYYFLEAKSRLDLPGCIHGDQGMLIHRTTFAQLGGFDENLSFLEDCAMADAVRRGGGWKLLPVEMSTSARRFEAEGLVQRQVLNALIMNFRALGWARFFEALPELYRRQDRSRKLQLLPYWLKIRELLARENPLARSRVWYDTGEYVRSQAWQLYYAWYCYRQFRRGQCPTMSGNDLREQMRGFERMTANPIGRGVTALLVWIWFYLTYLSLLARYRRSGTPDAGVDNPPSV